MGATVCAAVASDPALELVAAVDPVHAGDPSRRPHDRRRSARARRRGTPRSRSTSPTPDAAMGNLALVREHQVHAVVGTTGLGEADLDELRRLFTASNCVVAPNFAIGAVLMMRFAELAAPFFETAEIIELHHDQKVDAPSGTAMMTARRMAAASPTGPPTRPRDEVTAGRAGGVGPGGIHVHSVRLRGLVAHQEVLLGTTGQSLTIRHDSYDRTLVHARRAAGGEAGRRPPRRHRRARRPARVCRAPQCAPGARAPIVERSEPSRRKQRTQRRTSVLVAAVR